MSPSTRKRKIGIAVSGLGLAVFFIWFGYGETKSRIQSCEARVSKYVTAEFSEVVSSICTDGDGNMSSCTSTNSWNEPASKVSTLTTVNGRVAATVSNSSVLHAAHYPLMPNRNESMSEMANFDNFKQHVDTSLVIRVYDSKDDDYFSEPIYKNGACIQKIDQWIHINTWYGVMYSTGFDFED
jgi:hypothetical protein